MIGHSVSDLKRQILSLPVRFGGLGIANSTETSDREYSASRRITANLTTIILQQKQYMSLYHSEATSVTISQGVAEKEEYLKQKYDIISSSIDDAHLKRCLDIFSMSEMYTFFDVRVLHPNAPSYQSSSLSSLYSKHEKEKMKKYYTRVLTVEKGSFTSLVYTIFGGWAPQAVRYHKRLAKMTASKKNEEYYHVIHQICPSIVVFTFIVLEQRKEEKMIRKEK